MFAEKQRQIAEFFIKMQSYVFSFAQVFFKKAKLIFIISKVNIFSKKD